MSDLVRVCLVGGGRAGQVHANSIVQHCPQGRIVALVDCDPAILDSTGSRFDIGQRFPSLEEAVAACPFDAVVVTTPTFTHKDLTLLAAHHGKHIFCEKPMALTLADCDEMIAAAGQRGLVLQIGFMRRFDPDFEAAFARIEAGEIGTPILIKSLTHGPGLPPPWARDLKTSNGMLAEVNSHDWDSTRWLARSNPMRVYAEVANFKGASRGVTTPDFYDVALAQLRFENGAIGLISGVCPCEYGYDARVEIVGEEGILQIGDLGGQSVVVCANRDRGLVSPVYRTWQERFSSAYVREMAHFLECVRGRDKPRVTGVDGTWAVAGVLAATKSFLEKRPVEIAEVFAPEMAR